MPHQPESIAADTSTLSLAGLAWGHQADPPVVALHGWLDNAASFMPLADCLDGLRLIALDLPGHGASQHRRGVNAYHFVDYATDIIQALDSLELERVSLLGHSLGASVAALIASVIPERIDNLAMIEGIGPLTAEDHRFYEKFRRHIDRSTAPRRDKVIYATIEQAATARQKASDLSLDAARLIAERNLKSVGDGHQWRTDRAVTRPSPLYLNENQIKTYMGKIRCRSMLIRSTAGIVLNWEALRGREAYIKNLHVIDIEGGHHCHMDHAAAVAQHLLPFFCAHSMPNE